MFESEKLIVKRLIDHRENNYKNSLYYPSGLWGKWLEKLGYIFDLKDKSLKNIRLHVGFGFFLGSNWSTAYYKAQEINLGLDKTKNSKYVKDYISLTENIDEKYKLTELDPNRNEIGINYNKKFITEDILRTQTTVTNLLQIQPFTSCLEIGGGYGALANQLIRIFDINKYYIIDYPEILFWVSVWSKIVNPDKRIIIYDGQSKQEIEKHDLILVPNFLFKELHFNVNLLINENSFCEMSKEQVMDYLNYSGIESELIYSNNRSKQFMNDSSFDLNKIVMSKYRLFPTIDFYNNYYSQSPSMHNNKYIFFGSQKRELDINFENIKGLTAIRTEH